MRSEIGEAVVVVVMAAMSFLESVELAEDFAESSNCASIHSPRISFSNEFAQLSDLEQLKQQQINVAAAIHKPSTSGEFEFSMNSAPASATHPPVRNPPMLSADELFYKGKLLPLHLPPRIRMVQDLSEVLQQDHDSSKNPRGAIKSPPLGVMRRERSLRSPARPSVIASTLKSSSYPPPGYSSRPSSPPKSTKCTATSSRWRDLFGLKKSSSASSSTSSSSVPTKLLKMFFNRGSSSSSSSTGNPNSYPENESCDHHTQTTSCASNEAAPLLRDHSSGCSSSDPQDMHSSSISSSSSSNWAASSASSSTASSSSFSADLPDNLEQGATISSRKAEANKFGNATSRTRGQIPNRQRRSAAQGARYQGRGSAAGSAGQGHNNSGNLQRCGSNRKSSPSIAVAKMQLQDHVLIGNNSRAHSENSWRRPVDHKPNGGGGGSSSTNCSMNSSGSYSSVRVTPVLHVPACIGPSLRSVRVHGLRRLFSTTSSSAAASSSNAPAKPQPVM